MAVERLPEEPFAQLATSLIRNPDLSNTGFRVYALLMTYRWQGDSCFPSQERMAQDSGMTRKTIRAGIAELQELGLIEQQRRGQRYCNLYSFPDGSFLPIRHDSDEQKLPISISQWGKNDPSSVPQMGKNDPFSGVKITHEEEAIEKEEDTAAAKDSPTVLQVVCQKLGIKKDIDAEELVERSMATLPGTDHVARALKCKGHYTDWSKKNEMKRAGHYASFCETEKKPRDRPGYTITAQASNGGVSPTDYVRHDVEIKSTIPQFRQVFRTIASGGSCTTKRWAELEDLGEVLKPDGTLLFIVPREQREKAERLYRHEIDMACRKHNLKFAFGSPS